jgi:perosamine synthetase
MELKTAYRANPKIGPGPCEGSYAWSLEREIERRFHVKHAVALNSGTAALHCALSSLRLKPDDEVITSPLTFSATAAAIVMAGGRPVFADVDPVTLTLDRSTVKYAINKKTKAILFVHLFKAQIEAYREIAALGFPMVEDACQAVGSHLDGAYTGTLGVAGAYSFGSRKQVSAGEGGALVTNSDDVAWQARLMMNHGENFGGPVGYNYRPTEATCKTISEEFAKLKDNTPFLTPYLVEKRGPNDKPYIETTLDKFPAFKQYARRPLPVAWDLAERHLCVH